MVKDYDFGGWATRNDLRCSDGRTIRKNAFSSQNGAKVPLIWEHQHGDPNAVLGHAILENRNDGVYAYCKLNDTDNGKVAKEIVSHGDVRCLSIFANHLVQNQSSGEVYGGKIRELSLVLSGANPGAYIDDVMEHDSEGGNAICACWDEVLDMNDNMLIRHADSEDDDKDEENDDSEETIEDIVNTMNEKQKSALYALIGIIKEKEIKHSNDEEAEVKHSDSEYEELDYDEEGEENIMKHNAYENVVRSTYNYDDALCHSNFADIMAEGKKFNSLKEGFRNFKESYQLQHDDEPAEQTYGIKDVEYLFPEAREMNTPPTFISRDMGWVEKVMTGVHHIPFSRVKTSFADITEDEARAKGYIKGSLKKEEVFSLLKRKIEPTTVYKKQKMDKDDISDITDFDVLQWLKVEMRMMLNEELARAYLIGDGRLISDEDHIDATRIIPIMNDADLFVIRWSVKGSDEDEGELRAKNFIKACIKSRKNYKGSGNPSLYTTEDILTDMLLLEDTLGHRLYKTEQELATALRVKEIITVAVMENITDKDSKSALGIIVNLSDYTVGADKGGSINFFDDFDIDYNQQKYLIETRCSGALVKPFSAIVIRQDDTQTENYKSNEPSMKDAMDPFRINPS